MGGASVSLFTFACKGPHMSIDFEVYTAHESKDLCDLWHHALLKQGLKCEFRPDFDPATWDGGDLVAKVSVQPKAFKGYALYGKTPFVTGCGLYISRGADLKESRKSLMKQCLEPMRSKLKKAARMYLFQTSMGRSREGWRFQVFAAATLCQVMDGVFYSPQTGDFNSGKEALRLAEKEAADGDHIIKARKLIVFKTWKSALKDMEPGYTGK